MNVPNLFVQKVSISLLKYFVSVCLFNSSFKWKIMLISKSLNTILSLKINCFGDILLNIGYDLLSTKTFFQPTQESAPDKGIGSCPVCSGIFKTDELAYHIEDHFSQKG